MNLSVSELNLDEVLRYMGCPPDRADAGLRAQAQQACEQIVQEARPRWAWRCFDVAEEPEGGRLSCGLLLPGQDLKRHLEGCRRAALFCATLGVQTDALIRRVQSGDMLRGLALDCAADAAVEQVCDQIETELHKQKISMLKGIPILQ